MQVLTSNMKTGKPKYKTCAFDVIHHKLLTNKFLCDFNMFCMCIKRLKIKQFSESSDTLTLFLAVTCINNIKK